MADTTLHPSPGQTVGPFFHFGLIYPHCNELVDADAAGAVRLRGRVVDGAGDPVPDALVEIWQARPDGTVPIGAGADSSGAGTSDADGVGDGGAFTGFGRAATDVEGLYWFRTLEPGPTEPGRAAFFAVTVFARGLLDRLFTRAYVPSDALADDALLASLDPARRDTLIARRDEDGGLRFDIVLQGERETVFLDFGTTSGVAHA